MRAVGRQKGCQRPEQALALLQAVVSLQINFHCLRSDEAALGCNANCPDDRIVFVAGLPGNPEWEKLPYLDVYKFPIAHARLVGRNACCPQSAAGRT